VAVDFFLDAVNLRIGVLSRRADLANARSFLPNIVRAKRLAVAGDQDGILSPP
jgi:hypothetical protein